MKQREERTDKRMSCRVRRVLAVTFLTIVIASLSACSGDSEDDTGSSLLTENEPTANSMSVFTANVSADGSVLLAWETSTERDAAGFNLYRAATEDGPYVQMTTTPIPAQGTAASGASYSFVDTPGSGTFSYVLKDLDEQGQHILHGPAVVQVQR